MQGSHCSAWCLKMRSCMDTICSHNNYIKNHKVYQSSYFRATVFPKRGLGGFFLLYSHHSYHKAATQRAAWLLSAPFPILFQVIKYHSAALRWEASSKSDEELELTVTEGLKRSVNITEYHSNGQILFFNPFPLENRALIYREKSGLELQQCHPDIALFLN